MRSPGETSGAGQIPLDLPVEAALDRDDLIVSPSNALAVELVDAWPDWPGRVVILAGPPGSGKSHLARAWSERAHATILSMARIDASQPPQASNLVIEDAAAGNMPDAALFHLLNHVQAERGHCLITSRQWPSAWGVRLPDLASRLRAAQLVELSEPDDALLSAVIVKLFADRQIAVPPSVVSFLVPRMERSLEAAGRIVAAIDTEALARGARVSRPLAGEVLQRMGDFAA